MDNSQEVTFSFAACVGGIVIALLVPSAFTGSSIQGYVAVVVALMVLVGGVASVLLHWLLSNMNGTRRKHWQIQAGTWMLTLIVAYETGIIACLIILGQNNPWGGAVAGISGPMIGIASQTLPAATWPLIFVASAFGAGWAMTRMWRSLRANGVIQ